MNRRADPKLGNSNSATDLSAHIASAKQRLREKLLRLDLPALGISEYNQRYLGQKLSNIDGQLELYDHLLTLSLSDIPFPLDRVVFVDYGGGSGVLALFAKEIGIGTVVFNDIYDVSCDDARRLSDALDLPLDHIVCGDVDELVSYIERNSVPVNAIGSYDVLEHIYDVESHFSKLGSVPLTGGHFRLVYGSGANIKNPRYVRRVTKNHHADEYTDTEPEWGWKERDTLRAFLEVRKTIIADFAPELSAEQVELLARSTRGLWKDDIERCVDEYRETGNISYQPTHPTNTCDPWTGNWSEHLMSPRWLEQILRESGFTGRILPGRYSLVGSLPKKAVKYVLNAAISVLGSRGLFIAPYYVVYANRSGEPVPGIGA